MSAVTLPFHRSLFAAAWALLIAAIVLPACSGAQSTPPGPAESGVPGVPGVEVRWWMVDDRASTPPPQPPKPKAASPGSGATPWVPPPDPTTTLDEALASYANRDPPISPALREKWAAHGLDIIAIPALQLDFIRARLRIVGTERKQWFAASASWSEIIRGPECAGLQAVAINGHPVDVSSGVFRILMRCWVAPGPGGVADPLLQVELVPQHKETSPGSGSQQDPLAPAKLAAPIDDGTLLSSLLCDFGSTGADALVFVPRAIAPSDPPNLDHPFGPAAPHPATLGEAVLTDALRGGDGFRRIALVVCPRPGRFVSTPVP